MKYHVNLHPLILSLLLLSSATAQEDTYAEATVRDAMTTHVITSFSEKELSRLGDRAAVAVIRSLADGGLHDPAAAKRVLWVLETAFSVPQNIKEPADRTPKATLFLLHCISEWPVGKELPEDIERAKRTILSEASGTQPSIER